MVQFFLWCWWLNCVRSFLSSKPKLIGISVKQYFIFFFSDFCLLLLLWNFLIFVRGKCILEYFLFLNQIQESFWTITFLYLLFFLKNRNAWMAWLNWIICDIVIECLWILSPFIMILWKKKSNQMQKKKIQTDL